MPWVGFTLVIRCPFSGESQTLSLSKFCAWPASPETTPPFSFSGEYKPGCQYPGSQMGKGARKGISQISVNFPLTPCFHQSPSLAAVLTSPGSDPSGLISPETKKHPSSAVVGETPSFCCRGQRRGSWALTAAYVKLSNPLPTSRFNNSPGSRGFLYLQF